MPKELSVPAGKPAMRLRFFNPRLGATHDLDPRCMVITVTSKSCIRHDADSEHQMLTTPTAGLRTVTNDHDRRRVGVQVVTVLWFSIWA
jgi:hypothetical protein